MPIYKDNSKQVIKQLGKIHGGIAITLSKTANKAIDLVDHIYGKELNKFTLRNRFTKGAVKKLYSKAKRSSGGFRAVEDINAVVGVRKMKGGKDHYLKDQEVGGSTSGHSQTLGRVAKPLDSARTGQNRKKPIRRALRLTTGETQTLSIGGKILGVKDNRPIAQQWAILNRMRMDGTHNLKKPFFFTGSKGLGIYVQKGKRFKMIRMLDDTSVAIKPLHKFDKSFGVLSPNMLGAIFKREGKKLIKGFK